MRAHDDTSEWLVAGAVVISMLMLFSGGGKDKDRHIEQRQGLDALVQAQRLEGSRAGNGVVGGSPTARPRHTWTEVALMKQETAHTLDQVDRLLR